MNRLLLIVSSLIAYGSFYPFSFSASPATAEDWARLLDLSFYNAGYADLISNIVLFVPFGLICALINKTSSSRRNAALCFLGGGALAALIQAGQIWAQGRVPWGGDVVWNIVGCFVGYFLGHLRLLRHWFAENDKPALTNTPTVLAASLIIVKLAPFAPTLDFGELKKNFRSLFSEPSIDAFWFYEGTALWLVPFYLLSLTMPVERLRSKIIPIVFGVLFFKFIIVSSGVNLTQFAAGAAAVLVWLTAGHRINAPLLSVLLALSILGNGLYPFDARPYPIEFHWIPFEGALRGNPFIAIIAVSKKFFVYAALTYLFAKTLRNLTWAALLIALWVLICELLQRYFTNSVPEITDSLLVLLAGYLIYTLQQHFEQQHSDESTSSTQASSKLQAKHKSQPLKTGEEKTIRAGTSQTYMPSLDGLRAIAAFSVFMVHFQQMTGIGGTYGAFDFERLIVNGNTGVALFFVLSGFLLSLPFWAANWGSEKPDTRTYFLKRIARIVPAYYACMFVLLAINGFSGADASFNNIVSHLLFVHNLKDYQVMSLTPPFWTLAVEMQFYLILPIIFALLRAKSRAAAPWLVLSAIAISYVTYRYLMSYLASWNGWPLQVPLIWPLGIDIRSADGAALKYSTLAHLHIFLIGVFAASFFQVRRKDSTQKNDWLFDAIFWAAFTATIITLSTSLDEALEVDFGRYNFPYVPALLALAVFAAPKSISACWLLGSPPLRWMGTISYGIYLFHYPVLKAVGIAMGTLNIAAAENPLIFGVCSFLLTVILALLSYRWFEQPALRILTGRAHLKRPEKSRRNRYLRDLPNKAKSSRTVESSVKRTALWQKIGLAAVASVAGGAAILGQFGEQKVSITQEPWAGNTASIIFDHHTHSSYSDGSLGVDKLVALAYANGCDAIAITDHTDRRASLAREKFKAIEDARQRYPGMLVFSGLELGVPSYQGREHVNIIATPQTEQAMLQGVMDIVSETLGATGQKAIDADVQIFSFISASQAALENTIAIYNHPSRKDEDDNENIADFTAWRANASNLIGLSGAPGHQRSEQTGSYRNIFRTVHRWDPAIATLGNTWDQLLERGDLIWGALASSDYHNDTLDYAPCSYSRIHISAPTPDYHGIIRGLKAGTFWADHGGLLATLQLRVDVGDGNQSLYPGARARIPAEELVVLANIQIERGKGFESNTLRAELISNCPAGTTALIQSAYLKPDENVLRAFIPMNHSARDNCHVRARVIQETAAGDELAAYTNPIMFDLH